MRPNDVWDWAKRKPTPLRLADMYKYAANPNFRIPNTVFLHTELPIWIAQCAVDLLTLPFGLSEAAPIQQVACTYIRYLHTMLSIPVPKTPADEEHFTQVLQSMVLDQSSIPHAIAQGMAVWQHQEGRSPTNNPERYHEMEEALYRFFTARVGLRFLTEHHVLSSPHHVMSQDLRQATSMCNPDAHNQADTVGCIQLHTDLAKEVSRVAALVRQQCKLKWGRLAPLIDILNYQAAPQTNDGLTYIPHHLHYMMLELLKNSVRAMLWHAEQNGGLVEPICVIRVKGAKDVTIKVANKAGSIPRSRMAQIWKFAHSTHPDASRMIADSCHVSGAQLRGFGLPITRIYTRYFGGKLTLKSMEGYRLDAYLHLPRLGRSGEHLPPRVRSSPGELDLLPMMATLLLALASLLFLSLSLLLSTLSSSLSHSTYGRFLTSNSRSYCTAASLATLEVQMRQHFMEVTGAVER